MNKTETEKDKIILGITSFVQDNRKDYAEEIYRLWIEPFIDAYDQMKERLEQRAEADDLPEEYDDLAALYFKAKQSSKEWCDKAMESARHVQELQSKLKPVEADWEKELIEFCDELQESDTWQTELIDWIKANLLSKPPKVDQSKTI